MFDRVDSDVPPGQLREPVHHFPAVSWSHLVAKQNAYSDFSAVAAAPRLRLALVLRLPFEMPVAFLRFYLLRRHVTGGWRGFVFALTSAFARTLRIAKMLERTATLRVTGCSLENDRGRKLGVDSVGRRP